MPVDIITRHVQRQVVDGAVPHQLIAVPNEHPVGVIGAVLAAASVERVVQERRGLTVGARGAREPFP